MLQCSYAALVPKVGTSEAGLFENWGGIKMIFFCGLVYGAAAGYLIGKGTGSGELGVATFLLSISSSLIVELGVRRIVEAINKK